jgi:hypothetical protein
VFSDCSRFGASSLRASPILVAGVLPDQFDCVNSTCSVFVRAGYSSDIRAVLGVNCSAHRNGAIWTNVNFTSKQTDDARTFLYLQGPLQLLDEEGEWAVVHDTVYFWPYSVNGMSPDMTQIVITAPITQRVFSFVGKSRFHKTAGITLSGLRIVGSGMPATYTFGCKGNVGPPNGFSGGSPSGANCSGGLNEVDATPNADAQGMIFTGAFVNNCLLHVEVDYRH